MKTVFYKPLLNDGTVPIQLWSSVVFGNKEDCNTWMLNEGYCEGMYTIEECEDVDEETVTVIDGYGQPI